MNQLTTFNYENQAFNTIVINGEVWFPANQLAKSLGFANPRDALKNHVEEKDVAKADTLTKGGNQAISYVNESGMYALIFGSKKPQAKRFKHWVTAEVLPTIRKTGQYTTEPITPRQVSNADWQRYLQALTIPEMAKLTDRTEKQVIHGLYHATHTPQEQQAEQLGLPNLSPKYQQILTQFWQTLSQLDIDEINHAKKPNVLAINLPEIYQKIGDQLPPKRTMLQTLKHSLFPKFQQQNQSISSAITGDTKKCWVFITEN